MSNFHDGQKVVCIKDNFPVIATTESDKSSIGTIPASRPKVGETLVIDEILGDFLRFQKYDNESFNWWHNSQFRPIDDMPIMTEENELIILG